MRFRDVQEYMGEVKREGKPLPPQWLHYMGIRRALFEQMDKELSYSILVSEVNWVMRRHMHTAKEAGILPRIGDICYMDFGPAYLNECGFQHFGFLFRIVQQKALVVPMTSNVQQVARAYDPIHNPQGQKHLCAIGQPSGMHRPSVLFLNDMRYVNTARILEVKAHIAADSAQFKRIEERIFASMNGACS